MFWEEAIPYFSKHELACKGTGIIKLDIRFAVALPYLRQEWGRPLTATSICRSPSHNTDIGGHERSLHLTENPVHNTDGTMAGDILWPTDNKLLFARFCWTRGWSVGLHDTFIHIDLRAKIGLQQAVFVYSNWSGFNPDLVTNVG